MLSFASAIGNLFNRLGKIGLLIQQADSYQNSQLTNTIDTSTGVVAQYNGEPDLQAIIGNAYIGILNSSGAIVGGTAQVLARDTINRMIFRDNPRISQSLDSMNITDSIIELLRQMKLAGASILNMTITATTTTFTGKGNGIINTSIIRPFDGLVLENCFAETILFRCSQDSYLNNRSAGNETFLVTGTGKANVFDFNWPLGSDGQANLSAINGNVDNSSGNLLTNSGFEVWTNNIPNKFILVTGTAGTNTIKDTGINYDGSNSLRITGDADGTLTTLRQQFNSTAGTASKLDPLVQYSFNVFVRRDGIAPAAGVITVDLIDANNVVIQDENGVNNSFTIDLTTLSTVFASFPGVFRTPSIMPSSQYIRIRLTTALTNGRSVYLDKASMGKMIQLYSSGPYFAVHAGSVRFARGDYATTAITNSRGAGGTLNTWQTLMARLISSDEYLFPSSSSPTIADSLIG